MSRHTKKRHGNGSSNQNVPPGTPDLAEPQESGNVGEEGPEIPEQEPPEPETGQMEGPVEEAGDMGNPEASEPVETPETPIQGDPPPDNPPPPEPEEPGRRGVPRLLTVDRFLRRAGLDRATSDLVLSLYGTKIMSLADWESETDALLKRKIW